MTQAKAITKAPVKKGTPAATKKMPEKKAATAVAKKPAAAKSSAATTKKTTAAKAAVGGKKKIEFSPEQRYRMIAEAAYYRAEKRGFEGGNSAQDWIEAEAEITRLLSSAQMTH
ncbi:DUF2934 domain-containing protein [Sulfurirhabdus autotrophica]|uniref:DUF2934 family protein n=1 Tax=Sulfurirhabdus autotrophica TaxID=1706046 RepID=A0A4V2W1U0_9PROT|nr:DUF2934 domain-containing protein [Sulfurirhabdus autotrophica]TCV85389.1 DUF2934 family protein [Sulfurirhabdus autotrophica]